MNERGFRKRLAQELPRWQAQGWVGQDGAQAILADLDARHGGPAWASSLALAGAVLLGVGVITWFAAHWGEMSKAAKLVAIVVALLAAHLGHGVCQTRAAMPKLAQGMLLLSVFFFGAAIMLIGQIYHIDAHFPDGIVLWALGGLLTAWLFASQPALVVSLLLAAIWTWYEQFDYRAMNWPLPGFLALAAVPLWRHDWPLASRAWGGLLLLWLAGWHALPWFDLGGSSVEHFRLFALQLLGVAGLWALAHGSRHPFARAVCGDFLLAALLGAFVFTFPDFGSRLRTATAPGLPWIGALAAGIVLYAAGVFRLIRASDLPVPRRSVGIALAAAFAALLAAEVFVPRTSGVQGLLWNALFLGVLYQIGDLGIRQADRALVNRAFAGFSLWVAARYFDTFWTLLDRSLFFIAGGILLLAGGGWLERRRRALVRDMETPDGIGDEGGRS